MAPRVLLLAVKKGSVPLARAFTTGGFDVAALALARNPLLLACAPEARFQLRSAHRFSLMFADFSQAVERFRPDIIVPAEDRVTWFIRRSAEPAEGRLRETMVRSFGRLETMDARLFKDRTMALAASLGLAVPPALPLNRAGDLEQAGRTIGFPLVCKRSHGTAGSGVRICVDAAALAEAYAELTRGGSRARRLARRIGGSDWWPSQSAVRAETYIDGQPAMSVAVAIDGRPAAILTAVALRTAGPTRPAREVSLVRHDGMADITAAMIGAFGASGVVSFDFVIDHGGTAHLIECNPRPIRVMRWGGLAGVDLIAALRAALAGEMPAAPRLNDDGERVVTMEG